MNKKLFVAVLILVFTTILILSVVIAAKNESDSKEMNYGRCVSNYSKIQNNCFREAQKELNNDSKIVREAFKNKTINKTDLKIMLKSVRESYKNETNQCKKTYKENKEWCKQYKCKASELFNFTTSECVKIPINTTNSTNTNSTNNSTLPNLEKHYCDQNSTQVDRKVCLTIYDPVCGWYNSDIRCFKYPCAQTFSNSCFACRDQKTEFWTEGRCPSKRD